MNEDYREEVKIWKIVGKSFDQVHIFYKTKKNGSLES